MSPPFSFFFYPILFILAGNEDMHKILEEFDFQRDWTLTTELAALERLKISHGLIMEKWCLQASSFIFYQIFVKLAGNQDSHKISDEFELRLDRISHFGVNTLVGELNFQ